MTINYGHSFPKSFGFTHSCSGGPIRRAKGGGISIKPSRKGLLHKNLGVAAGKPISTSKLESAKAGASPAVKKRIVFAENARKWSHPGGGK